MRTSALLSLAPMFATAASFAGCVASDETSSDPAVDEPTPVATLKLANGHVVEFYDWGGAGLIAETGAAYTSPAISSAGPTPAGQMSDLWSRLAPGTPVPPALADLQHRLTSSSVESAAPEVVSASDPAGGRPGAARTVVPAVLEGCNNGCCDRDWLNTLAECQGANWTRQWFNFNDDFSTVSFGNVGIFQGLVCAAQGTSTFSVNLGGSGGTWSVPEATYRWFHWTGGTDFFGGRITQTLSSAVNSQSNEHIHTYCGRLFLD